MDRRMDRDVIGSLEAGFEAGRLILGSYVFLQCDALSTDPHDLHPFSVSRVRKVRLLQGDFCVYIPSWLCVALHLCLYDLCIHLSS